MLLMAAEVLRVGMVLKWQASVTLTEKLQFTEGCQLEEIWEIVPDIRERSAGRMRNRDLDILCWPLTICKLGIAMAVMVHEATVKRKEIMLIVIVLEVLVIDLRFFCFRLFLKSPNSSRILYVSRYQEFVG